jgi:hypothetical protein
MNKRFVLIEIISIIILSACIGKPKEKLATIQWTAPDEQKQEQPLQQVHLIIEPELDIIPEWVKVYDNGSIQEVEKLSEYQNNYIFVAENRGTSFNALQQWVSNFKLTQDLGPLIASRIQTRLTRNLTNYPDNEYGGFFEALMKAAFDASYAGAVQEADYWIQRQYYQRDGVTVDRKEYVFLILISINKSVLKFQLDFLLNDTKVSTALTRDQNAAINRIKTNFYQEF